MNCSSFQEKKENDENDVWQKPAKHFKNNAPRGAKMLEIFIQKVTNGKSCKNILFFLTESRQSEKN